MKPQLKTAISKLRKEEWTAIRRHLLKNCEPFSSTLEKQISDQKWVKDRANSLEELLLLCQSDQEINRLIDAFKICLEKDSHSVLPALQNQFLRHCSEKLQNYGSLGINRESFTKQRIFGIVQSPFCCTKTSLCVLASVSTIISLLAAIAIIVYLLLANHQISNTQLGLNGDTVLVGNPSTPWNSRLMISECLQEGDYYHKSDISVVLNSDLIVHQRTANWSSRVLKQPRPSLITGVVDYMYLIEGSKINYKLCMTNEGSEQNGTIYIFDNRDDYFSYLNEISDPSQNAVFLKNFTILSDNQTTCIDINYVVTKSSYYFLTASTPGNIYYNYTYNILTLYYNHTDYDVHCSVLSTTTCDISLPFGYKEYAVLAYIHPLDISDPLTTHVCLQSPEQSNPATDQMAVAATVGAVSLLLFIVTLIFLVKLCYGHSHRKGYVAIGVDVYA